MPDNEKDYPPDMRSHYEHPGRPPLRLEELSPETRQWLANKRPQDLKMIDEIIELQRTAKVLGRISKWLFVTLIAMVIAMGELGQAFSRMINFLSGGKLGGP